MAYTELTIAVPTDSGAAVAMVDADIANGNKFDNDGSTFVDLYNNGDANQKQTVSITGTPAGGTFTLTYSGQTTAGIAYNADAAAVQAALVALSNIASGDVVVSGSNPNFTVTFGGAFSGQDCALLTADAGGLTGGSSPGVTIAAVTGSATVTIVTGATIDGKGIDDTTVTLSNGQRKRCGPFKRSVYNVASGDDAGAIRLTYSGAGAVNVDVEAVKV